MSLFRDLLIYSALLTLVSCSTMGSKEKKLDAFLDDSFHEFLKENPQSLTYLGKKERYSELSDMSYKHDQKMMALVHSKLKDMKQFDPAQLSGQSLISYKLYKRDLDEGVESFHWRDYGYTVNQQYGPHTQLPAFMINMHQVKEEKDLKAYLDRLKAFPKALAQTVENLKRSEKMGVLAPRFVYPKVIGASINVIQGQPFEAKSKNDSPLFSDFKQKMSSLKLTPYKSGTYLKEVEQVLTQSVKPAYTALISELRRLEKKSDNRMGVWKFPKGGEYYNWLLKKYTTTNFTADKIHQIGLREVSRLRKDMKAIQTKLGYKGSLKSFFKKVRKDPNLYFPNTPAGEKSYLDMTNKYYQSMLQRVPEFFHRQPKAKFLIKPVEKFRQNSAGIAFYEGPAEDGSRPGTYYVNTKDMKNLPKYEAEAILYHEGAPGHHFQIAFAQELKELPITRRYSHFTSYVEGWGLYTERLAKEMGGYKDTYSELGRLSAEMLRAVRLVVDTGLHSKKWTKKKALQYFNDNVPASEEENLNQVERYIVMPGQATAYMVGMLKIYELRETAKKALGEKFDIRDFHEVVLGNGAVPLDVLEELVHEMISKKNRKVAVQ